MATALSPPPEISRMLGRACADCHSNETRWPWYSRLEPAATMIAGDVDRGRAALNFSEWPAGAKGAGWLLAGCSAVESGVMPKQPYRLLHPDAAVSRADADRFCSWAREQARVLLAQSRAGRGHKAEARNNQP
jgi:hypothetical protein